MTISRLYGLMCLTLLLASSCSDSTDAPDSGNPPAGSKATVSLSISAVPVTATDAGVRAIPDDIDEGTGTDYSINDFWLMEYSDGGTLIGSPQHYTAADLTDDGKIAIPLVLPDNAASEYKCVIVANTHSDILGSALGTDVSTIDKLKALCRKISTQDDLYNTDTRDLLMNCVLPVTSATKELDCKLYRNTAKLTLKLTNSAGSKVKINSVQLCNIPDRQFYADRLYATAAAPSPTTTQAEFINWEVEEVVIDEGTERTLVYYLPCNIRGTNSSTHPNQKNIEAPDFATYIEIMAEDKTAGSPLRYRFYPGGNMTNDFNIIPNRHYTLPITITAKGSAATDSRVEDMGTIVLPESNSYIVNPLNGGVQLVHSVPIGRINKFWSSVDGRVTNDDGQPENNTVDSNTEWVAEVIWQDQPQRLIDFCDADGTVMEGNTHYAGKGVSYFHFKPVTGRHGNVLIGVRKASAGKDAYLWSWHLWITDYNPDRKAAWKDGVYAYEVKGGQVHRYESATWNKTYKNKYIMDRNLGAMSAKSSEYEKSLGLYYQYGRKDAFPHTETRLYNIDGQALSPTNWQPTEKECIEIVSNSASNIYQSIKRPYSFFYLTNSDWVKENPYYLNIWNNPNWYSSENGKSIFDPSPPGWKVPYEREIYEVLWRHDYTPNAEDFFLYGDKGYKNGWECYMGGERIGETTWYPGTGQRHPSNNPLSSNNYGFYLYSATGNGILHPIRILNLKISAGDATPRCFGLSIRCIQE